MIRSIAVTLWCMVGTFFTWVGVEAALHLAEPGPPSPFAWPALLWAAMGVMIALHGLEAAGRPNFTQRRRSTDR